MKRFFFFGMVMTGVLFASPMAPLATFDAAVADYQAGKFKQAAEGFESLLAAGVETTEIHYDLAEAYYREKDLGQSIFHFRKAQDLSPRDPDIRYNLSYARRQVVDRIEDRDESSVLSIFTAFNQKEGFWALVVCALLFWSFAAGRFFSSQRPVKWGLGLSAVLFVFALIVFAIPSALKKPFGVITADEGVVYSGMGKENVLLFTLHKGAEFSVEDRGDENWLGLKLADGKKGWIQKSQIKF